VIVAMGKRRRGERGGGGRRGGRGYLYLLREKAERGT
jgi:hypothetical protein